jgi:GH24 family phage-related lysozyme (muramidase)
MPLGASGVTIGTGFDLGQQNDASLDALGLPEGLAAKLRRYTGMKRLDAVKYLADHPLVLTEEEVAALDKAVHEKYIMETAVMFGREAFEAAPEQAQAVAVSLHYQFGTPRRAASPALSLAWDALRTGKYKDAAEYLTAPSGWSAEHRKYLNRRKQEAALLREIP